MSRPAHRVFMECAVERNLTCATDIVPVIVQVTQDIATSKLDYGNAVWPGANGLLIAGRCI